MRALQAMLLLTLLAGPAATQTAPRTRDEVLNYALSGVGSPYIFGGSNWDPANRSWGGCDCSGLVGKAWAINDWVPYRQSYHPYATVHLIGTPGAHWYQVAHADAVSGDALVYRYPDNSGGHTFIFEAGDAWGSHRSIEAANSSIGIVHRWRNPPASYSSYKAIRRLGLIENYQTSDIIVESDHGAPNFTFVGAASTSGYDSYAHFLREGDCTYAWVQSSSADEATFQPTIPAEAYYEILVSCNQASPNVADARVHVHHAGGTSVFLWNQATDGVNEWHALPGRYLLRPGQVDRVVWDDLLATPRDGSHIFRADATMFRLSNDVVVDGIGGAAGRFATLGAALQWLQAHPSLDPDRIEITTDLLVENAALNVAIHDDLEIVGDADGNGVPCTLVVTPGVTGNWSAMTGIYLQVAPEHAWRITDLEVIPAFVGPGVANGAVALAIDTQSASRKHTELSLELERVTLTGCLAGNVAADHDTDQRASCTRWGGGTGNESGVLVLRSVASSGDSQWQRFTARDLVVSQGATRGVALNAGATRVLLSGACRITWNDGEGLAFTGGTDSALEIAGGEGDERFMVADNGGSGIHIQAPGAYAQDVSIRACNVLDNGTTATDAGLVTDSAIGQVSDCIFAFNSRYNWYHRSPGSTSAWQAVTAERCTFHDARYASGDTSPVCVSSLAKYNQLTLRDCVFTGPPEGSLLEALYLSDDATGTVVSLDHCALVTKGPQALSGTGIRNGEPRFTKTAVIVEDPRYASTIRGSDYFLYVVSPYYFRASSTGQALRGGAGYLETVDMVSYGD